MGLAAEAALKIRQPGQTALALLDMICRPYEGCDAEFEGEDPKHRGHIHPDYTFYTDPVGPLGVLIAEAFAPDRDWVADWRAWRLSPQYGEEGVGNVRDMWEDGPMEKFDRRYDFN